MGIENFGGYGILNYRRREMAFRLRKYVSADPLKCFSTKAETLRKEDAAEIQQTQKGGDRKRPANIDFRKG